MSHAHSNKQESMFNRFFIKFKHKYKEKYWQYTKEEEETKMSRNNQWLKMYKSRRIMFNNNNNVFKFTLFFIINFFIFQVLQSFCLIFNKSQILSSKSYQVSRRIFQVLTFFLYKTPGWFGGFLPMRDLWMWGMTPPPAMVALISESSSSSPRMANCKWRGLIRFTLRSLLAFPANSRTSAVRYSRMAAL